MPEALSTLRLARHDMVRVDPAAWAEMLEGRADLREEPMTVEWAARGRPLVVRRMACDDAAGMAPLGLPLPPARGKRRIGVRIPALSIRDVARPPRLADLLPSTPASWRKTVDRLLQLDDRVRAYGSLAWQHLTGLSYLTETSDLDLLWQCDGRRSAEARLAGILDIEGQAPMRLDGEWVAPDNAAAHWRELLSGADPVLVKRLDRVELRPRHVFLSCGSAR